MISRRKFIVGSAAAGAAVGLGGANVAFAAARTSHRDEDLVLYNGTSTDIFDESNYTAVAASLSAIYGAAFDENLSVRFEVARSESARLRVSCPQR